MLPLYFMADVGISSHNSSPNRCVRMPVSMLLYWYVWANITQVSGFKLDVVAQAQHIGRVVDCGPGHAGTQSAGLKCQAQYIALSAVCPITQSKLISSNAIHHSLHVVPEPLLRRRHVEICPSSAQIPSFLNNSILAAAVIYSFLLLTLE